MKSLKKTLLKLIPVVLLLSVLLIIALLITRVNHHSAKFTESIPKESADALNSPYCGWYHIYSYTLQDNQVGPIEGQAERHVRERGDERLALLEINLSNYREEDVLSSDAIDELDLILAIWSETDTNLILRFLYDWGGNAAESEPENLYVILGHISQVAMVVNDYVPSVYIVQGAFIGNYGEMHGSRFNDEKSLSSLLSYMLSSFDSSIWLSVRTPAMIRLAANQAEPATLNDAENRTPVSRVGLFNDGMLGSETDLGTYADEGAEYDEEDFTSQWPREEEIAYLQSQCLFVPNGGEVVIDNELNDFENAIIEFSMTHVSYLNEDHDEEVIAKWKDQKYDTDDPYYGLSQFEYISRHLGYRYVIRGASFFNPEGFFDKNARLTLRVENVGYSNCYRNLSCTIKAVNTKTHEGIVIPVTTNPRFWQAGQINLIDATIPLSSFTEGESYQISVSLADKINNEPIRFANAGDSSYDCTIGTLEINSGLSFAK